MHVHPPDAPLTWAPYEQQRRWTRSDRPPPIHIRKQWSPDVSNPLGQLWTWSRPPL